MKIGSSLSALLVGLVVLTSGSGTLASSNEDAKEVIRTGEYNYDTGEFKIYEGSDEVGTNTEIGIRSHDPKAGGGTWYHDFIGIKSHYSNYDHKLLHHRASAANSQHTVIGPWKTPTGGFSYAEAAQSLTGNKAYWNTTNVPGMEP